MTPPSDDAYKREEDRRWRESVESRLVSLTSAQKTTDDEMDELAGSLEEHDEVLHGVRSDRMDTGLIGQVNTIETGLQSVLRLLHPDNLGHGGLLNEHKELLRKVLGEEKTSEYQWRFWSTVAVALISLIGLLITSWPNIEAYWAKSNKPVVQRRRGNERPRGTRARSVLPPPTADEESDHE